MFHFTIRELMLVTLVAAMATGCMVEEGGSSLIPGDPDIQYFDPGPEFRRTREEAKARAFEAENSQAPAPSRPSREP